MSGIKIITVDSTNFPDYGLFCVTNRKHPGYIAKSMWLEKRFSEGLRLKIAVTSQGTQAGFIEYVPGEYSWRAVNADGYMMIHCIWVNVKKAGTNGTASLLIEHCMEEAVQDSKKGLAVLTSEGSWIAGSAVYLKNGFEVADNGPRGFQLFTKRIIPNSPMPFFPDDWDDRLSSISGLQMLYVPQCPYIGKALEELPPVAKQYGIELKLVEMKNASEAREKMPSPYGSICLVHNGKLLAEHSISATRFRNILEKDLKLAKM